MKASTKRILTIAFSGVFLIATLVVYGNFIRPTIDTVALKRDETASKEAVFTSQTNAVLEVQNIISQVQGAEDFNNRVALAIPRGTNVTEILYQIHSINQITQTELLDFSVESAPYVSAGRDQTIVKRLGTLNLTMSVRGEYESLKTFLESLETNIRIMNVTDAAIFPTDQSAQSGLYMLNLKVETYFQE